VHGSATIGSTIVATIGALDGALDGAGVSCVSSVAVGTGEVGDGVVAHSASQLNLHFSLTSGARSQRESGFNPTNSQVNSSLPLNVNSLSSVQKSDGCGVVDGCGVTDGAGVPVTSSVGFGVGSLVS